MAQRVMIGQDVATAARTRTGARPLAPEPDSVPASVARALESPGEPVETDARLQLESRLGADLSGVRVHRGEPAERSARLLGARAYTVASHLVFGRGEYSPDTSAGRRLLAHEMAHTLRSDSLPIRRQALPINFEHLAERLHEAMAGWGTDEEAVYLALQQTQRDPAAIARLEAVYLQRYGRSLEAEIREELSGEELEYALQLLDRGNARSPQAIQARPSGLRQMEAEARRLRHAVEGWGTDEEAIYAVLLPLNRNMRLIHELMDTYQRLFSENLRERIIDEMSGSELDYALYLMGGSAMRVRPEITEVTETQAQQLFDEMARLTFWTSGDREAPVPYHYPPDGCYARAHLMAERMTELGIASEKVFAVSTAPGGLTVATPLAGDMPPGQQANPTVNWWYHVAPVIRVRTAQGQLVERVLDPSLASTPIAIDRWWGMMRQEPYDRMTVEQIQQLRNPRTGAYPMGRNLVFTTPREVFYPTEELTSATPERAAEEMEDVRGRLTSYARYAEVHELAAFVRAQMATATISVSALVARFQAEPKGRREGLWMLFPNLCSALLARLSPTDLTAVRGALFAP